MKKGMCVTINAIESCIDCITAEETSAATLGYEHIGILSELMLAFKKS